LSWIKSLQSIRLRPEILVVEEVETSSQLNEAERRHIATLRANGCDLTNLTDGGEGRAGHIASPETRAKMSTAHRGAEFTAEHRARLSEAASRRRLSAAECSKISTSLTGRKRPQAEVEKTASALRGKPKTHAHRAKLAAAMMGRRNGLGHRCSPEVRLKMSAARAAVARSAIKPTVERGDG
jgi:hypothetical protein